MSAKAVIVLICLLILPACISKERIKKAESHFDLGKAALSEDNIQGAFVEFQKAVELNPGSKEFHNGLGNVYFKLLDYRKAEKSFLRATTIDSDYSEAYNNLCVLYYTEKQWQNAVDNCKNALNNTLYQTAEKSYYNLGRAYYRLGMYKEAAQAYWEAIKRLPALYPAYYGLALSYNAQGDYGPAATAFSKGIELDPRFKGDRAKAEAGFKAEKIGAAGQDLTFLLPKELYLFNAEKMGRIEPEHMKDLNDLLEILNY